MDSLGLLVGRRYHPRSITIVQIANETQKIALSNGLLLLTVAAVNLLAQLAMQLALLLALSLNKLRMTNTHSLFIERT